MIARGSKRWMLSIRRAVLRLLTSWKGVRELDPKSNSLVNGQEITKVDKIKATFCKILSTPVALKSMLLAAVT